MKIAVVTGLFAKGNMNIDACHLFADFYRILQLNPEKPGWQS